MQIHVRLHAVDGSPELAEYVSRRAHARLSRFGRELTRLVVRISDLNGPRGGRDKRCQLLVTGPRLGTVSLRVVDEQVAAALDRALDRLAHQVGKRLERARAGRVALVPSMAS